MSEYEKEISQEKEKPKEIDDSLNKNNTNNNIKTINNMNQLNNNINIITSKNNNNEEDMNNPQISSNNSPKSSYGGSYPSPFSSKSNRDKSRSNSNYSNSKNSYRRSRSRSRSRSHSRSHSHSDSKSPRADSKSDDDNSSNSHRISHHKQKSIPQVFITKLRYYVTKRDLEKEFGKFGDIKNLTLKKGYAFIEYYDKKDAKYAIRELNGRRLFGQSNRIVVEEAKVSRQLREKEKRRKRSKSRDKEDKKDRDSDYYYRRKTGPKKTDICFSCGKEGHWANECQENRRDR